MGLTEEWGGTFDLEEVLGDAEAFMLPGLDIN